ncbi:MAG: hypothetical protein ABIQ39_11190, partial [Ilumatobacteraceae bacterium]
MSALSALAPTDLAGNVSPTVSINSIDLTPLHIPRLLRTVVDTRVHLPDMFELTFQDTDNSIVAELMIRIGALVEIYGGSSGDPKAACLIKGEITSIEGDYEGTVIHTIIRGYEKSHRLQRSSRTRTFVDMTDSDIASQIAREAGFSPTDIEVGDSSSTHRHVSQISQTDWDFLRFRAQEIGFEVGVAQGGFFFRKASSAKGASGGGLAGAASTAASGAAASLTGEGPPTLTFKQNLMWFRPRRSAANIPGEVEVRVYDYKAAEVVVGKTALATGTAKLGNDPDPQALAGSFTGLPFPIPTMPQIPGLPSLGLMPSTNARAVIDRPMDWG